MTLIEISRKLAKDAELEPAKADAIMQAVVEYSDTVAPVTREHFDGQFAVLRSDVDRRFSELRSEMTQTEARMIKWIVGTGIAVTVGLSGVIVGSLNLFFSHFRP